MADAPAPPIFTTVDVAADGPVGRITLNRPDQLNPLSTTTLRELAAAARWFDGRPEVKAVVVAGRGRAFCAGADLAGFRQGADPEAGPSPREAAAAGRQMAEGIEAMRAVTVARVHGHCVGGGVVLLTACDLRVAAAGTRFAIPELDLGIPLTWGGLPRLVRDVGAVRAKELVLTCRAFDAEEALAIGLVTSVVAADQLDAAVDAVVDGLVRRPALALAATKQAVGAIAAQMVGSDRAWSDDDLFASAVHDPESRAVAAAYLRRVRRSR